MKPIKNVRSLAEVITDSVKLIFRNFKALTALMSLSVMLPSLGVTFVYLRNSINPIYNGFDIPYLLLTVFLISLFFMMLHVNLVSLALVRVSREDGVNNVTSSRLSYYFRKLYFRNLAIALPLFIIVAALGSVAVVAMLASPGLGIFFLMLVFLFIGLYLYPLWLYAQRIYLTDDDLTMGDAFKQASTDLVDNYGMTFGTLLVANVTSSFLQYMILIPFFIIAFALTFALEVDYENSMYSDPILMFQSMILAYGLSYLYLFVYIAMFLKSYDIEERRTGETAIGELVKIGAVEESFFENEGEY